MNPEELQPQQGPTPDQSAAALSFATMLSQQALGQNQSQEEPQDGSETPQDAPGEEIAQEPTDIEQMESRIMDEIASLRDTIEQSAPKDKNTEIEELKKEIEAVLNDNGE